MKKVFVVLFGILYGLGCQPSSEPRYSTCLGSNRRACPVNVDTVAFVEIIEVETGLLSVEGWRIRATQPYVFGVRVYQDGVGVASYYERDYNPADQQFDTIYLQQWVSFDTIYPTAVTAEIEVRSLGTATDAFYWKDGKVPIRNVSCAAQNVFQPGSGM